MASYQATDKLAIAAGPVVTTSSISFTPAFFAAVPGGQFGPSSFPSGTNGRPFWGGGFQVGLLYNLNQDWNLGFSYKSPVWLEKWGYNATNPDGSPRFISLQAGVPAIYSWGVAYKGLPKTLLDVDLRYFDYPNTPLFGPPLKEHGLGWLGVFSVAVGGAYQLSERTTLRGGYLYNTQVVPTIGTLANIQAPAITQHTLSLGATIQLTEDVSASAAWVHGFRNSVGGSIFEVPGASGRLDDQYDSLIAGLNIQLGRMKKPTASAPQVAEPPKPEG
jgi:long-chain fatty acid transport protein